MRGAEGRGIGPGFRFGTEIAVRYGGESAPQARRSAKGGEAPVRTPANLAGKGEGTMGKIRVAVVGYGNLGRYSLDALKMAGDMEIAGIVRRQARESALDGIPVVDEVRKLGRVDVALLCVPTLKVVETAKPYLTSGIATVDSFDIHGQAAWDTKQELDKLAKQGNTAAVTAAGWDPGLDSVLRAAFRVAAPTGITYTNYGPGMSLGHSVAARSAAGVEDAVAITYPLGSGRHRRLVYAKLEPGADPQGVRAEIAAMNYFKNDELVFTVTDDLGDARDCGHGMVIERKGSSGATHNQRLSCSFIINNPAITTQVMVMAARAATRRSPGAYTLLEIPPCDYFAEPLETLVKTLV